jgi:hypothetical protein
MKNQTASAFGIGLYKSCHEQIYSYHNLYLTITVYIFWSQRCMNDACWKCMVELKQILVHTKCKFGPNSFLMCCLSLIHAVSQAKCQKSYLLNILVLQELIVNLSLHSRSTKIIIILQNTRLNLTMQYLFIHSKNTVINSRLINNIK